MEQGFTGLDPASAEFTLATQKAVKQVQDFHHLQTDGIVGPDTWPYLLPLIPISRASKGPAVAALNHLLDNAGYHVDHATAYTPGTERALRDFQRHQSLPDTGIATEDTWRILLAIQPPLRTGSPPPTAAAR